MNLVCFCFYAFTFLTLPGLRGRVAGPRTPAVNFRCLKLFFCLYVCILLTSALFSSTWYEISVCGWNLYMLNIFWMSYDLMQWINDVIYLQNDVINGFFALFCWCFLYNFSMFFNIASFFGGKSIFHSYFGTMVILYYGQYMVGQYEYVFFLVFLIMLW